MSEKGNTKGADGNPKLSLCMMVKDEERLLPQCLESARDVVDEIIVVDTGSTDRTVEIAEGFGA
ncbi:MAG: glycosyltransferase, partial [Desulfobacteraceae bacterium]